MRGSSLMASNNHNGMKKSEGKASPGVIIDERKKWRIPTAGTEWLSRSPPTLNFLGQTTEP